MVAKDQITGFQGPPTSAEDKSQNFPAMPSIVSFVISLLHALMASKKGAKHQFCHCMVALARSSPFGGPVFHWTGGTLALFTDAEVPHSSLGWS